MAFKSSLRKTLILILDDKIGGSRKIAQYLASKTAPILIGIGVAERCVATEGSL